jgi:thiamine biosynthesis protein ThiI
MAAVGAVATLPLYRPLAGDDKQEIIALARRIGTYEISSEPFHDCCPVFMPRKPALHATTIELDAAEATLDVASLVARGVESAKSERFRYIEGRVERAESEKQRAASAQTANN